MDELIRLCKKAANEWRNTDTYYQAAVLIDSLCERLEKIENRKPYTNADRIRSMSDEELAKILNAFTAYFEECNRSIEDVDCHDCELCWLCSLGEGKALEWLQKPVKEE